ncbi:hypothetical protein [Sphingopyxis alaskensis]|uniref:ACT domain-containing protein n=1 Tax=Sphingopyxis alaskensis (strain DSM 13593 / LMG 18877 / RB2256) TaxID=317655 RepID=Q1GRN8_SPHAL|nr:hypothetical protein [Sphingopyxis alaskensis]ABF53684.1 hypothetical protein Sala_1972 [Sphingopyxis alaskensis RB2256]MCM3418989.1 hypothetical protein [Sphingopyxis alaskensis]
MYRFEIDATPDPQALPRVANVFAQRALVPAAITMNLLPTHIAIEVVVAGLDGAQAAVIAAKLGEGVAVLRSEAAAVDPPLRLAG